MTIVELLAVDDGPNPNNDLNGFKHYRCAAHIINLAVQQGIQLISSSVKKARTFMSKIKNSVIFCDELKALCELKGIKYLAPETDVETR